MQESNNPRIFISYSWSSNDLVMPLAERLVSHGVDVVLDKWDLKEGQDKYAFMERCVNDPQITRVLIISDRQYASKANSRTGGVGDETAIISSEIYGKIGQEKFIPIVVEYDSEGNPCLPTYVKSRIYIDLSENNEGYEAEYEKLLRNIYEKPLYSKPKLGKRPEWLDEEQINVFPLVDLLRQISGSKAEKKQTSCINQFISEYIKTLKTYFIQDVTDGKQVFDCFVEMKKIRDVFLDFLPVVSAVECPYSEILCEFFEQMYNTLTCAKGFNPDAYSAANSDYEIYRIHIWELFICTIAFFRNIQDYKTIHSLLTHTYFLTTSCLDDTIKPDNYCRFRHHSDIIEDHYKPSTEHRNKLTLMGYALCCEREKLPIYSKEMLAEADLFLYQIRNAYQLVESSTSWHPSYWFPTCYVYANHSPWEWKKMQSRKFCEKMYDLFGVDNIDSLKRSLQLCTFDKDMHYSHSHESAPAILNCIKLEEIGSLN